MKFNHSVYALLSVALICGSQQVFAGALDELSQSDRDKVVTALAGEQKPVSIRVPIDGDLWPEFKVYEKVNATPEEAAAVFADFKNHKNYFSKLGITKSDVVKGAGTSTQEVDYYLDVTMASDDYACVDHLTSDPSQGTYAVHWDVTKSSRSHAEGTHNKLWSQGNASFEPYDGGTLIAYTSLIDPIEATGVTWGWVINRGEATVQQTVDALVKQIESELNTPELDTQKAALKVMLAN